MTALLSQSEIEKFALKIRNLSNNAEYKKAHQLSKTLSEKYPNILLFAYHEAVLSAEDDTGCTSAEIKARHKSAALKLKKLLKKLRSVSPNLRAGIRNEYYWFSHQPYKQYLLGREQVRRGIKRAYYAQGVGAAMLAKKYGQQERRKLCLRWAKRSERAWLSFFTVDSEWFNSYFFYARALGYQGRASEM